MSVVCITSLHNRSELAQHGKGVTYEHGGQQICFLLRAVIVHVVPEVSQDSAAPGFDQGSCHAIPANTSLKSIMNSQSFDE